MRISRAQMFMGMARVAAMRSTCFRLNVGAVAVVDNRPVSVGYNGARPGSPHCTGNDCPGHDFCTQTVHAETNALLHIPGGLIDQSPDLYVTHSPCEGCTFEIIKRRVRKVFFEASYRESAHLAYFRGSGIELYQVTPAGYVIDWWTRDVIELAT